MWSVAVSVVSVDEAGTGWGTGTGGKEADGEVTTEARALNVAVTGRQLERVIQRAAQQLAAAEARLPPRISLRPPPSSRVCTLHD